MELEEGEMMLEIGLLFKEIGNIGNEHIGKEQSG